MQQRRYNDDALCASRQYGREILQFYSANAKDWEGNALMHFLDFVRADRCVVGFSQGGEERAKANIVRALGLGGAGLGGAWTIVSPILMTVLLLKVSGVSLLEKDIGERRPAYRDYNTRTNALLPGPPPRKRPACT